MEEGNQHIIMHFSFLEKKSLDKVSRFFYILYLYMYVCFDICMYAIHAKPPSKISLRIFLHFIDVAFPSVSEWVCKQDTVFY